MYGGFGHDGLNHGHKADMLSVLKADGVDTGRTLVFNGETAGWHQAIRLQFFATQAHHHHFATKIRVQANVANRTNWNNRFSGVNGHATTVGVL